MCGIAGFIGQFEQRLLTRMNATLAHRGPDDGGIWFDPKQGIGLAHRRLSIIELSPLGHQPMWDATQTVVIVFNGEIYNYRELRQALVDKGFAFNSHSDTEVLLNLYLQDGIAMLPRLNGIFAFALWNTRSYELLIVRDGVGVKPLYYAHNPQGFLFASELKAILQEPSVERMLDPLALQAYLTYLWCPAPRTPLQAVQKLEPGHAMLIKDGQIHKHWQFYDLLYQQPLENLSVAEAIAQAQFYLKQAVQRQMVADVPVGTFLSGGLDSSAVTTFAKQSAPDQALHAFTIGFSQTDSAGLDGMAVDLPYAQRVAAHLGAELHTIQVGADMIRELEKMLYFLDEPQADPAPINVLFISQLAREHGMKVLLSGTGGDDIFTGYRRHFALMQERYWTWLPRSFRKSIAATARSLPVANAVGRRLSKGFQYADWSAKERLVSYFFWLHPELLSSLYGPMLRDHLFSADPATPLLATLANLPDGTHPLNQMLYLEGKHFLCDHNLNYTDKMGMATGVEIRVPLLDPDLIAFAARLPITYKQHGHTGKWIFKKAMERYLPREVIYRRKTGFGAPLRYWMKHQLRPLVAEILSEATLNQRGLFDPAGVQRLLTLDQTGRVDAAYPLFALMCIELWCRIFLDQKGA